MERFLIYDDNDAAAEKLKILIENEMPEAVIDTAYDISCARNLLKNNNYTVLFLDIELENGTNGIYFADELQKSGFTGELVYITAHTKYYEELFITSPSAFIEKPFTEAKIKRTAEIIRKKRTADDCIILSKGKNSFEKIYLKNISYIEYAQRRLYLYNLEGKKIYSFYDRKISELEEMLPNYFLRCHQSYIVNMKYISGIKRFCLYVENASWKNEIPVSQPRFSVVKTKYIAFLSQFVE